MLVSKPKRWGRAAVLAPALIVGACAVAATAHGGYEVAVASQVPEGLISALYPVITDGLALVAYAATHQLRQHAARRYAWTVVVLAAALSGLAQAVYLATGPTLITPPAMRFGVGAWPAVAGAVAAHLVYLLAHRHKPQSGQQPAHPSAATAVPAGLPLATVGELVASQPEEEVASQSVATAGEIDQPATSPPRLTLATSQPAAPGEDELAKARRLLASGIGRPTLAKELGIELHEARQLQAKPDRVATLLPRYLAKAATRS